MAELKKMELTSASGASINLEALYQICPSAFTEVRDEKTGQIERKINFTTLRELLGDNAYEGADEEYGFNWVGKRAAQQEAGRPINKTLRPCPEESVDWEHTQNLYIEGDNLDVLKLLQKSYLGAIKMIYIDPPYNTGNDFVYRDDFAMKADDYDLQAGNTDELGNRYRRNNDSNLRFHSDWCSMIYERLLIARNLLSNDGIIFISIDDNEVENLKIICNEVFGEKNCLTCITRGTGTPTGGGFDGLVNELDYILVYAKNITSATINGLEMTESDSAIYDHEDEYGRYLIRPLRRTGGEDRREDRPTMFFPVTAPDGTKVYPIGPTGYESRWICGEPKFNELLANHLIEWKLVERNGNKSWSVYQKFYLEGRLKAPGNLWVDVEGNKKATRDVRNLFDTKKVFDFPKPIGVLEKIISIGSNDDSIILDFFSGSATTAHAVMNLNSAKGNRKYIMVQIPEVTEDGTEAKKAGYNNICELGKERIRRAGKKIKAEHPEATNLDTGFRVFKLDESNMEDVYFAPANLTQGQIAGLIDNVKQDRNDLDLLFGCMLDWGVQLSLPLAKQKVDGKTIHIVNDGDLVACFDDGINEEVINAIAALDPLRVVFRDSGFESAPLKINLFEMFKQKCGWSEENVTDRVRII